MKLCLCFHCLCESYEEIPSFGQELFVSTADMQDLIEQLLDRGYSFTSPDDEAPDTVSVTFDDGYYNNHLFGELSVRYQIPYLIFVSFHYASSGVEYPWMAEGGTGYADTTGFDFYEFYANEEGNGPADSRPYTRPMSMEELKELKDSSPLQVGCHGYYHQALSNRFEKYLLPEQNMGLKASEEQFGIRPNYYALANGIYTRRVMHELLESFDKVFTIDGRPFRSKDRVVHRLNLVNPHFGGPLIDQIDWHLNPLRQLKRSVRIKRREWF
jgi:hypothetical protein